jgi:hypothetical protein
MRHCPGSTARSSATSAGWFTSPDSPDGGAVSATVAVVPHPATTKTRRIPASEWSERVCAAIASGPGCSTSPGPGTHRNSRSLHLHASLLPAHDALRNSTPGWTRAELRTHSSPYKSVHGLGTNDPLRLSAPSCASWSRPTRFAPLGQRRGIRRHLITDEDRVAARVTELEPPNAEVRAGHPDRPFRGEGQIAKATVRVERTLILCALGDAGMCLRRRAT